MRLYFRRHMQYMRSLSVSLLTWMQSEPPNLFVTQEQAQVQLFTSSVVHRPKAPPATFAKIHVDAAVRTYRGGSAVAICRDSNGDFMGSSALVMLGEWEPATLEVIACREAIALAERFVVASDCKQVIRDITKGYKGSYGSVISEIGTRSS